MDSTTNSILGNTYVTCLSSRLLQLCNNDVYINEYISVVPIARLTQWMYCRLYDTVSINTNYMQLIVLHYSVKCLLSYVTLNTQSSLYKMDAC